MGVSNPSYFITTKNKKNMENAIIVPFDLNTARKIKSGEIEGSVLIDNIEIEFVYESKDCAGPYNLLFVKKDGYGISAIYANTEGCTLGDTTLELEVEAGAYFKKGDVLISTLGNPFIYNGIINREGDMGCIYGISAYAYNCLTMIAVKNPEVGHIMNVNVMRCLTLTDAAIRNAL